MVKKVLIVGLFLGGGYLFIKKILPIITKGSSITNEANLQSIEDILAEEERKTREAEKEISDKLLRTYGTTNLDEVSLNTLIGNIDPETIIGKNQFGIPILKGFDENKFLSDGKPKYKYENGVLKYLCDDDSYSINCR